MTGRTILPCGCEFWDERDAFVFMPHALDCEYAIYVREESARQGKPIEYQDRADERGR